MSLHTYSTAAAVLLPGLVYALLGHLVLRLLLQLWVELLYQPVEALVSIDNYKGIWSQASR